MGMILAKLRKKTTTYEQLEKLDNQIKAIEEYGKTTEITQKKVAGRFLLISVFVYVVTAATFYFYFFPPSFYERMLYVIPLIAAPLIIVSVKRILTWWYTRKLKKNHDKLSVLKEQKKKMLDKVMETETYKVAKKILETFAPDEIVTVKSLNMNSTPSNLNTSLALSTTGTTGLRYRGSLPSTGRNTLRSMISNTPASSLPSRSGINLPTNTPRTSILNRDMAFTTPAQNLAIGTQRLPMARTILPRERSALDKLVDYLVGDGPSNRYALICKDCSSHNGMALREEFEYLSFHCCYCHCFNPAKKQRPPAPKLGASRTTPPRVLIQENTSESEKNSGSDSELETSELETLRNSVLETTLESTPNTSNPENVSMVEEPIAESSPVEKMEVESIDEVELIETPSEELKKDEERD